MSDEKDLQPIEPTDSEAPVGNEMVAERVHADEPAHTSAPVSKDFNSLAGTIRQTILKRPGSREQVPATEASDANLSAVNATTVVMKQSGAENVTADRVTMEQSGTRSIDAKSVQMDQSGTVALSAESVVMLQSSAVQVVAEKARLSKSSALYLSSGETTIEDSRIGIFAGKTDGDVRPLITAQTVGILIGALATFLVVLFAILRANERD